MKPRRLWGGVFTAGLGLALLASAAPAPPSAAAQTTPSAAAQAQVSPKHKEAFAAFEARVKEYVAMREGLEDKMPKLPKDAAPEQIEKHKAALQVAVRAARAAAKPGDIFTAEAASHIREVIKSELKPETKQEVRETALEGENKAVPLRVNQPYPESQEMLEMPPTLLLKLPQLPKQIRYRYVGRSMLLMDRENGLIIDFMHDALP